MPVVTVSNKSRAAIQKMEQAQADLERSVEEIIAKGKPWTDPDFPPEIKSLYDPKIDQVDEGVYKAF